MRQMVRVKQENIPDHQYFHNSSQGVTIFRILLSALLIAGRIAVSAALGDSRGGGTAPAGLPDLKRGSWMLHMAI